MRHTVSFASILLCFWSPLLPAAHGQSACLDFSPTFGGSAPDGRVHAQIVYDDGSGPALYLGGEFTSVGAVAARGVARWDGATWSQVGGGMDGSVHAFAVWNDGSGAKLYAGGSFTVADGQPASRLARWDGEQWSEVGGGIGNQTVYALAPFDDGNGSALYVGGSFAEAGGETHNIMARWDGGGWSGVGIGFVNGAVRSLVVYDDGAPGGARLYAGGSFTIHSFSIHGVAAYDSSGWSVPGGSPTDPVFNQVLDLNVYDDGLGGGARLFVSGTPTPAAGISSHLGAWDGTTWSAPGGGTSISPSALGILPQAGGEVLVACGAFTTIGGSSALHIARWNGVQWQPMAGGIDGIGDSLAAFAGELFVASAVPPGDLRLEVWDATAWSNMPGAGSGLNKDVRVLHVHDDGTGQALYAAGDFTRAGTQPVERIARWNGASWSALGAGIGVGNITALETFDSGSGPELYVAGFFTQAGGASAANIARWNGVAWVPMPGTPVGEDIRALEVHDDGSGPALYVAGRFHSIGGLATPGIARWDGTSYSALGPGLPVYFSNGVLALAAYDDGGGTKLYAGGSFSSAFGTTPGDYLVRWNGSNWEALPPSNAHPVWVGELAVSSVGGVARLFAACNITIPGGPFQQVAAWDGATWTSLGSGTDGFVESFVTHDDGTGAGAVLYAAGYFQQAGGVASPNVARWNGASWSSLSGALSGGSLGGIGRALAAYDDGEGSGRDLYVGGGFTLAGSGGSANLAQWEGCGETGIPLCFGNGSLATACPCANFGVAGHGCANSQVPAGALLEASGVASQDTVVLSASAMMPANMCIFLQGSVLDLQGTVFGDGLRCASGQLLRLALKSVQAGNAIYPEGGDLSILQRNAQLGAPITHPSARVYQTYYRDSAPTFCASPPGGTFNATNGVKIVW